MPALLIVRHAPVGIEWGRWGGGTRINRQTAAASHIDAAAKSECGGILRNRLKGNEQANSAPFYTMSLEKINTHKDVYPAIAPETYSKEEFEGKVVIVTGSGSGIGKATALAFSELGAKVAFTDLTIETAQSAADEAKPFGNKTVAVAGNVTKLKDMEKLVAETTQKLGPVDCIVFAAGYGMFDKFEVSRSDDWWGLVETNLKGPTDLTRLVLPDMIKRNTGTLIYIASRVLLKAFSSLTQGRYWRQSVFDRI